MRTNNFIALNATILALAQEQQGLRKQAWLGRLAAKATSLPWAQKGLEGLGNFAMRRGPTAQRALLGKLPMQGPPQLRPFAPMQGPLSPLTKTVGKRPIYHPDEFYPTVYGAARSKPTSMRHYPDQQPQHFPYEMKRLRTDNDGVRGGWQDPTPMVPMLPDANAAREAGMTAAKRLGIGSAVALGPAAGVQGANSYMDYRKREALRDMPFHQRLGLALKYMVNPDSVANMM